MKKIVIIIISAVFILSIVLLGATVFIRHQNESRNKTLCINRQRHLYAAAESFCLENGCKADRIIKIEELVNNYFPGGIELAVCPSDRLPYAPFTVANGPVCPNGYSGHDFAPGESRPFRAPPAPAFSKLRGIYEYSGWTNLIDK